MDDQQPQNVNGSASTNRGFNSAGVIEIRLNTDPVLTKFEDNLRGNIVKTFKNEQGEVYQEVMPNPDPIMNEVGFQNIMMLMNNCINSQVVQGNFTDESKYEEYLFRFRMDLSCDLMDNAHRYNLNMRNYSPLISQIMRFVELFMTRPIKNKERDSYGESMKTSETIQTGGGNGSSIFSNPFQKAK